MYLVFNIHVHQPKVCSYTKKYNSIHYKFYAQCCISVYVFVLYLDDHKGCVEEFFLFKGITKMIPQEHLGSLHGSFDGRDYVNIK